MKIKPKLMLHSKFQGKFAESKHLWLFLIDSLYDFKNAKQDNILLLTEL